MPDSSSDVPAPTAGRSRTGRAVRWTRSRSRPRRGAHGPSAAVAPTLAGTSEPSRPGVAREDPGSRRQVPARRPGPARPRLGGRPDAGRGARGRRAGPSPPGADAVVIKAQVLVGGRGKAGGVKLASDRRRGRSRRRARSSAWTSRASRSARSSSPPAADIVKRVLPGGGPRPGAPAGSCSWARPRAASRSSRSPPNEPEAIVRVHADPHLGLLDWQAREMAFAMGLGAHLKAAVAIAKGLVRTMLAYDADLVEINPLAIVRETGADGTERSSAQSASTPRSPSTTRRWPAIPGSRTCATSTRRTRPTRARARPRASASSSSTARSAAWSTGPAWR